MRVAILHPSLGFGGAERLITDVGWALRRQGHRVTVYTAQFDRSCAFEELRDGTVQVRVRGAWLPQSVGGRVRVPATIARTSYLALCAALDRYDVLLVDLVAYVLPLTRLLSARRRVLYYCHFPDLLLTPSRSRAWYRLYRRPLDSLEGRALEYASTVMVNSAFTAETLRQTFPRLGAPVEIVRPGVDTRTYHPLERPTHAEILLLSIGRYEPKKGLRLAIDTLAVLRSRLPRERFARLRFVHAGGLSRSTPGSTQTHAELLARTRELGLEGHVELMTSISDAQKLALLRAARALLFTPQREHFGIVPLEAMACGTPVVATDSGGPRETIVEGATGYLCAPDPSAFADRLARLICDDELAAAMGARAAAHVQENLSRESFALQLRRVLEQPAVNGR
jgi:alpha-1,3/alpha-1,6-mannosyltransferase